MLFKLKFVLALLMLTVHGVAATQTLNISAMTFNIRVPVDPYPNDWNTRKQSCYDLINKREPDVIGFQEMLPHQYQDILDHCKNYKVFGLGREANGGGEGCYIMYHHEKFSLDANHSGTFWYSSQPNTPGSSDWGNPYKRICTYVRLIERSTQKGFTVFNSHWSYHGTYWQKSAELLLERILTRSNIDEAFIVMGDLNIPEGANELKQLLKQGSMRDPHRDLYPNDTAGTFHGWGGGTPSLKIDHIFGGGKNFKTLSSEIIKDKGPLGYPSDHYPIVSTLAFTQDAYSQPFAHFTTLAQGLKVAVDGSSSYDSKGEIIQYTWDFGDDTELKFGEIHQHHYTRPGEYQITLTVTDDEGQHSHFHQNIIVHGPFIIPGKLEAEHYSTAQGAQKESCSDDGGGKNMGWFDQNDWLEYQWIVPKSGLYRIDYRVASDHPESRFELLENHIPLSQISIEKTGGWQTWKTISQEAYLIEGSHHYRIKVLSGGFNINWIDISVLDEWSQPNQPPKAAFHYIIEDQDLFLDASSSSDSDGYVMSYHWDFGDGNTSTDMNPFHQYLEAGEYSITLKIIDDQGAEAHKVSQIYISSPNPPIDYNAHRVQAEDFTNMHGVQTEVTSDHEGGVNVGWIDREDWMEYSLKVHRRGRYALKLRVASLSKGGAVSFFNGDQNYGTINLPVTHGWQNWTTVSTSIYLEEGTHRLTLKSNLGGWNINWFELNFLHDFIHIEAEDYIDMKGIQTEMTSDIGAGLNVGWIQSSDWLDYDIDLQESGTYLVHFRLASNADFGSFEIYADRKILGQLQMTNTYGWQNWQTMAIRIRLNAGKQKLRILATNPGFNINWIRLE